MTGILDRLTAGYYNRIVFAADEEVSEDPALTMAMILHVPILRGLTKPNQVPKARLNTNRQTAFLAIPGLEERLALLATPEVASGRPSSR
jgi:hypothetical protein